MGNQTDRVSFPLSIVTGGVVGSDLLDQLKSAMLTQNVFKAMFGENGQRLYFDKVPSYSEAITPGFELYWKDESIQNWDTYLTGNLSGSIFLPTRMQGDVNAQRRIATTFTRFIGSDKCDLFDRVAGLTEFGLNTSFRYDKMVVLDGGNLAVIDVTIPFKFDLKLLSQKRPEINYHDDLDAQMIGWLEKVSLIVKDDNTNKIEGVLFETGKTN